MTHTTELQQTAFAGVQGEYGIIKTDSLCRLRISSEHRESLLDAYEQSSMSRRQFAEYCGVKYTTFTEWMTVSAQFLAFDFSSSGSTSIS